jgi:hypothetical protein
MAENACGIDGDNLTWELKSGILTIQGEGDMADWDDQNHSPWYEKRDSITGIVLEDGVTSIGAYAFKGCREATSIRIPDEVRSIYFK